MPETPRSRAGYTTRSLHGTQQKSGLHGCRAALTIPASLMCTALQAATATQASDALCKRACNYTNDMTEVYKEIGLTLALTVRPRQTRSCSLTTPHGSSDRRCKHQHEDEEVVAGNNAIRVYEPAGTVRPKSAMSTVPRSGRPHAVVPMISKLAGFTSVCARLPACMAASPRSPHSRKARSCA